MKAKANQMHCRDHGMSPLFSRPRKPNDNPFIESASSRAKRAPEYPGWFLDDREAMTYFTQHFNRYDTEHYHSGIASSPRSKPTTAKERPSWKSDAPKPSPGAGAGRKPTEIWSAKNQEPSNP
jgi:hypothetical protein